MAETFDFIIVGKGMMGAAAARHLASSGARIALILIWVGFMAIFRGITEIVMAFELHHAKKSLAAAA